MFIAGRELRLLLILKIETLRKLSIILTLTVMFSFILGVFIKIHLMTAQNH